MRIITNEKLIHSRSRWARWLMPIGLFALLGGFVLSLNIGNPQSQVGSWIALIIGVFASTIGVNLADKWLSLPLRPRADETLESALKTLDLRHKLYNWTLPAAEHVLLSPAGLTVLLVKKQEGTIICKDGKWRNKLGPRLWLASLSREKLGNPTRELKTAIDQLQALLKTTVPDLNVPVDGLIVVANPQAKLEIDGCEDSVATPADLRDKWRGLGGMTRRLTESDFKRVEETIDQIAEPNAQAVPVKPVRRGAASTASPKRETGPTRGRKNARSRFARPTRVKPKKEREGEDEAK